MVRRKARGLDLRGYSFFLLLAVAVPLISCNRPSKPAPAQAASPPQPIAREAVPHILAVSPDALPPDGSGGAIESFHVTYRIDHPELVEKATLQLFATEVRIGWQQIPIQQNGEVDFKVGGRIYAGGPEFDIIRESSRQPALRIQVECPQGVSDWFTLGALHHPDSTTSPKIEKITPDFIREETEMETSNGGVDALFLLNLYGDGFNRDCKAHYVVGNGSPIDATSLPQTDHEMIIYVTRRPLGGPDFYDERYVVLSMSLKNKPPYATVTGEQRWIGVQGD